MKTVTVPLIPKCRKQMNFIYSVFTEVKRDESSKQGMLKRYHSTREGIRKWYLFREKYYHIK